MPLLESRQSSFGLVVTPGPNMIYLVSRSLSQGRRAGLISLAGVACGFLAYLMATTAGLAALFVAVPALFIVVKLLGAAYLLYLVWGILRPGGRTMFTHDAGTQPHSPRRLFVMGLTTCLLNPKIALIYAALLPQFIDPARTSLAATAGTRVGTGRCSRHGQRWLGARRGLGGCALPRAASCATSATLDHRLPSRRVRGAPRFRSPPTLTHHPLPIPCRTRPSAVPRP